MHTTLYTLGIASLGMAILKLAKLACTPRRQVILVSGPYFTTAEVADASFQVTDGADLVAEDEALDEELGDNLEANLAKAEEDQRFIDGLKAEDRQIGEHIDGLVEEIQINRDAIAGLEAEKTERQQTIAEDVNLLVDLNAQVNANRKEMADAEADRQGNLDSADTLADVLS